MDTIMDFDAKPSNDQAPVGRPLAGIIRRWIAFAIDMMILGVVDIAVRVAIERLFDRPVLSENVYVRRGFEAILCFAYFTFFDCDKRAGSLGKQTMSMQVADRFDNPLTLIDSAKRAALKIVFSWIPLMWLIPALTRERQALHDILMKTYVVET